MKLRTIALIALAVGIAALGCGASTDDADEGASANAAAPGGARGKPPIGGRTLMSKEEIREYRGLYAELQTDEQRRQFEAEHIEKMRARAIEQGSVLMKYQSLAALGHAPRVKDLVAAGELPEGIPEDQRFWGRELMTERERIAHRKKIKSRMSAEARREYRVQHYEKMKARAIARGIEVPELMVEPASGEADALPEAAPSPRP